MRAPEFKRFSADRGGDEIMRGTMRTRIAYALAAWAGCLLLMFSTAVPVQAATELGRAQGFPVAVVVATSINVRGGPGTNYPIVGGLSNGVSCAIFGRNADASWWQVGCPNGVNGWVFTELIAISGDITNVPIVNAAPPPQQVAPPAPPPPSGPVQGGGSGVWAVNYWNNRDLIGDPVLVQREDRGGHRPLNRNWQSGSPAWGVVDHDNFSARWRGSFSFDRGDYRFSVVADDGVRVFIDGIRVIDAWRDGHKEVSNIFRQLGGGTHEITIEYYEAHGQAYVWVWWDRLGSGSGRLDE